MRLRKQDVDVEIVAQLPRSAVDMPLLWLENTALLVITAGSGTVAGYAMFGPVSPALAAIQFFGAIGVGFVSAVASLRVIRQYRQAQIAIIPSRLRKFAKKCKNLEPVDREYCRVVASLAETSLVSEETARQMLLEVNTLLMAYRRLADQKVSRETRAERQESAQQTFRALRKSLKQIHDAAADSEASPATLALEIVDTTTERLQAHVRNVEQATSEIQSLRH